ncbi:MAG: ATP-binding protein [Leptolyngbyaceae cyanobacterium bins.59]|nr:ATP-binding protein [Leptolyngbyaceae cyanobacterium bins.59]
MPSFVSVQIHLKTTPFLLLLAKGQKTGLGLSSSYQIVKKHGGTLECQSQTGKGTEFCIEIPVRPVALLPAPSS